MRLLPFVLVLAACGTVPSKTCTNPNVGGFTAQFNEASLAGGFCGNCNAGLLTFAVQDSPRIQFQASLPNGKSGALKLADETICASLTWRPADAAAGENQLELDFSDRRCGGGSMSGISGGFTITSAPGSGRCTGAFAGRLGRARLDGREEYADVAFNFDMPED